MKIFLRLWVQPRLYLQYHQWSRKAESINVTHYVVTYQDVLTHLQKESYHYERLDFHEKNPGIHSRHHFCDFSSKIANLDSKLKF